MNPLTLVKRIQNINQKEATLGISEEATWHAKYKDSAYFYVGGLPFDLTEGDLLAVFAQYGEIVDVNLVRDKGTGKSKGFAFLAYEDQRSTNLAVDNLNGAQILGRTVRVDHVTKYKKLEEEDEETRQQKREERGVCRAFQKGECKYGDSCKFSHDEQATPTSVPETQVPERESPVELVNLEKVDSGVDGRRKRASWRKVDDEVLARSFVTISNDQVISNDQKANALWGRVASNYNENRPTGTPNRSASVIRSHWHNTIQKKVYHFNANYNSVSSACRSGHNDDDILQLAYEKYHEENNGIAFNLEHVWRIVKDCPMFTPHSADHLVGTKKVRTSESGASNTSSSQDESLHVDLNEEDTRPMGQKTSKRKGKSKAKSSMEDMTVNWDNMFAKFTEYTSMKKAEVEMKQKHLALDEMKTKTALAKIQLKEYAILLKDTSQMTEEHLIFHKRLCQEIRRRWNM